MSTTATTRILHAPANANTGQLTPWVWPLPRLDGVTPCILASAPQPPSEEIDIGYQDRSSAESLVPVFAAQDGIVTYAGTAARGPTLCIDHAGGWSTQYAELQHVLARPTDRFRRRRKERVCAGDVIGHARRSALKIRFSLSRWTDEGSIAVDPVTWMPSWSVLPWFTLAGRSHSPPSVAL